MTEDLLWTILTDKLHFHDIIMAEISIHTLQLDYLSTFLQLVNQWKKKHLGCKRWIRIFSHMNIEYVSSHGLA